MAIWRPLSCFLLLLFVLLFLASFIEAQNSAAQVSKQWINNEMPLTTTITSLSTKESVRLILSTGDESKVENHLWFGFYSRIQSNSFFLVIGQSTYGFSRQYDYDDHFYIEDGFGPFIWSANRNHPVSENATLQFLSDGNLVLRDVNGTFIWSTNTSDKSVVGMELMKTGNLVLHDFKNNTVWQSFDRPTDALVAGQKLKPGQQLVARVSDTDVSEGNYRLHVTSKGMFASYQSDSDVPLKYLKLEYSAHNSFDAFGSIELNYHNASIALRLLALSVKGEILQTIFQTSADLSTYFEMRFDPDGHLRIYDGSKPIYDVLEDYLTACEYPTSCGSFGICSDGQCSCPADFLADAQDRNGCSPINPGPTFCESSRPHSLLSIPDAYHLTFRDGHVDADVAFQTGTDVQKCKQACTANCSCKVAVFRYLQNLSVGDCYLPSPVHSFANAGEQRYGYKSYAFIKIWSSENGEGGGRGAKISAKHTRLVVSLPTGFSLLVVSIIAFWIVFLRKKMDREEELEACFDQLPEMPARFTFEELKLATGDFQKKLGEGGFGSVFEGSLPSEEKIAVKRLDNIGQGMKEFMAEVKTIGSIHHVNLVRLIGFCTEKFQRLLVYEFMWNGSLDKWIFSQQNQQTLDWETRRAIILDIAKGLAYLHEECRQRIVHLDIKPQNILLDTDLNAKIADFGLSKLIDRDQSQVVTTMRGTPGYMAPEWFSSIITEKVDVYSFGIVVMEVVCGRKNLDRSKPEDCMHLLPIFMNKAEKNQLIDMVDRSNVDMEFHKLEAVKIMQLAIWCLQSDYRRRPSMSSVVKVLEGTMDVEADLDYSIQIPAKMAIEAELGATAPLSPSLLSGTR